MLHIAFVFIFLFFFFCQYVSFNDSDIYIARENVRRNNIAEYKYDNVVLYYRAKDYSPGYVDVLYFPKNPEENHYVYGRTFWYQTISIKSTDIQRFAEHFNYHVRECHGNRITRECVNVCGYSKCSSGCCMSAFEKQFCAYTLKLEGEAAILQEGMRRIKNYFFFTDASGIEKHARKREWKDFFTIVGNRFRGFNGEQIYSEGATNKENTYLYLLTHKYMYELGFNIKKRILFLMRVDLIIFSMHRKITKGFYMGSGYIYEMPSDNIFTAREDETSGKMLVETSNDIKLRSEKQYSKVNNLKQGEIPSDLRGGALESLKLNEQSIFERKFWRDILSIYNDPTYKVDFNYYNQNMSLL